jgi:hypothetical protein
MASITDRIYDLAQALGNFPTRVGGAQISAGAGAPGAAAGLKGSVYLRLDGGANTTLYVREAAGVATAASGVYTLSGNPSNGETVTIDGTVYTFVTALSVAFDVLIGAAATNTLDNLVAAITAGAGSGTVYGTGTTAHPSVTAAAGAGDTIDVTAQTAGVGGNSIAVSTNAVNGDWGGETTLSGGAADDGTGWVGK